MSDWGLLQPLWLLLTPAILLWWLLRRRRGFVWPQIVRPVTLRFPLLANTRELEPTQSQFTYPLRDQLLLGALLLFVLALAQPVRYTQSLLAPNQPDPLDLVLLVDTNITLVIKDYELDGVMTERMSVMRQLLGEFIQNFSGERLGLAVMGDPPMLWLPYTSDHRAVADAVARLQPALGGRLSDMSASLQLVSDRYRSSLDPVVIMVTDSSLQLGARSPQDAAASLLQQGFTLYVMAMGSGAASAPASDSADFVYEPVDLQLLAEVAQAGGGKLFHAADAKAFEQALALIAAKHRTAVDDQTTIRLYHSWYPLLLGLGLLTLLGALIGGRR